MSTTETTETPHVHPFRMRDWDYGLGWGQLGPFLVEDCPICRYMKAEKFIEELVDILRCVLDEPDACRAVGRDWVARATEIVEEHP